ncbi:MAG: cytochrome c oxidase subunit II [Dehalococcoidia bacterium]|nr:cytochrome c oxidase subunit II [Dehalococcoidia bacterium]
MTIVRGNSRARITILAVAIPLLLFLSGCAPDVPQTTLVPSGLNASLINDLFGPIFWMATGVFVVVEAILLFAVFRYRRRAGDDRVPEQVHGNTTLEIGWTIAPAILVVIIVALTFNTQRRLVEANESPTMTVEVIGHQWWWEFRYPDQDIVTANELHVPLGEVVALDVSSSDVIHSFWVPKLAGKADAVPGHVNQMWLRADEAGIYFGQCAELCGIQHALMRFRVVAQPRADFDSWVVQQRTPPDAPQSEEEKRGAELFATGACIGCHTIEGTPGQGVTGPNLTHVGGRTTIAAGVLRNTAGNLYKWLREPQVVKKGALMPDLGLSDEDARALVAYLLSLK